MRIEICMDGVWQRTEEAFALPDPLGVTGNSSLRASGTISYSENAVL
jgi:hypothetical protein